MRRLVRLGPLVFRDPLLLCGALYLLLWFDASGFLRIGLCAAVLHEMGHIFVYLLLFRRFPVIEVTMTGFCMRTRGQTLTRGQTFLLAAVPCGQSAHRGVQPSACPTAGWSSNAAMSVAIFAQIG